jgi:hypothetical protein
MSKSLIITEDFCHILDDLNIRQAGRVIKKIVAFHLWGTELRTAPDSQSEKLFET